MHHLAPFRWAMTRTSSAGRCATGCSAELIGLAAVLTAASQWSRDLSKCAGARERGERACGERESVWGALR